LLSRGGENMFKLLIAYSLAVFLVCVTIITWAQEPPLEREASERLVVQIDQIDTSLTYKGDQLTVSTDSQRVAYRAKVGDKEVMVVDGKEGKPYDLILDLSFSPNSQRLAYRAIVSKKRVMVVDGKEVEKGGKPYDYIGSYPGISQFILSFSPNSQ